MSIDGEFYIVPLMYGLRFFLGRFSRALELGLVLRCLDFDEAFLIPNQITNKTVKEEKMGREVISV